MFELKKALDCYEPYDSEEAYYLEKTKDFLKKDCDHFSRKNQEGHIVAGALVVDKEKNVLLNLHKTLDIWIHFGGHSDGEKNSFLVAKREVFEESKICDFDLCEEKIFDVDVHLIPENKSKKEPEHLHYDICFLFVAKNKNFVSSDESKKIEWKTFEEAKNIVKSRHVLRMIEKAEKIFSK